jgi:hypothetical protein
MLTLVLQLAGAPNLAFALADTDGDGCADVHEQQTAPGSQMSGGLRDYLNPYDYFNPTNDGLNRVDDILAVVGQYGIDPGSASTDRSWLGPDDWDLGAPDGLHRMDDVLAIVKQYFHDCNSL